MRNQICQLSLRCLFRVLRPLLELHTKTLDLRGLKIGHVAEQANNKGYIIVFDRVDG